MTRTASRPHCRTAGPAMAGVSTFASLRATEGRLTASLPVRRSLFTSPETSEGVSGRNAGSPADRRAGRSFVRRFAAAGAALLLGAAFLFGGGQPVQAQGNGEIYFYFSDDGDKSTIKGSGNIDLSKFTNSNFEIGESGAIELYRKNGSNILWGLLVSDQWLYRTYYLNRSRFSETIKEEYTGTRGRITPTNYSNPSMHILLEYNSHRLLDFDIHARTDLISGTTYSMAGREATFDGTLSEVFNDDSFHFELNLHTQKVIFSTWDPDVDPPDKVAGLKAESSDRQVTLTWDDPSDSDIARYQYRQKEGTGKYGNWTNIAGSDDKTVSHVVTGLTRGTTYSFQVRAMNTGGGVDSNVVTATLPAAPAKPAGLTATAGSVQVTLKWTNPNNDTITKWQYRQKVNTSNSWGSWSDITGSDKNTTEATVTAGLTNGTEYAFQIRAVNNIGNGAESDGATATPNDAPSTPTVRGVVPGDSVIRVTVRDLSNDTAWQGRCRATNDSFGSWANAADAADTGNSNNRIVTISGLRNNTTYVCQVRALNGTVEGAASAETAEATPHTTPNGPGNVSLTPGDGSVVLQWSAPGNVNASLIVKYQYKQSKGDRTSWGSWQNVPDNATAAREHRVTGLENGVIHYFVLRANTAVFEGSQSADDNRAPGTTPAVAPARPTLTSAEAGDGIVSLAWTYTANSAAVADWQHRRKESSAAEWGAWTDMRGSATTTRFTVSGVTNGRTYDFQVRARTSAGVAGVESNTRSATPAAAPAKPTGFTAEAGDRQVTLTWTGPENAHIIRYEYQQKEGSGSFSNWEKMNITGDVAAAREYRVTGLMNGTAYAFKMRAVTVGGDGPASDASASVTPDKTPRQPSGFKLEPGNRTIKLVWNDQSDDPVTIVRWQYMEKIGDAAWPSAWTDISPSDKDTTSLTLDRLTNGTVYGYRIRAVATGNLYGERSDDRFATPAGPPVAATLTATAGARRVTLSWTLAADASIQKWQYQKLQGTATNASDFANVAWDEIEGSGAATRSHTVRDLEGDVTYSFRVRAIGYGGDGVASDIATATAEPGPSVEEEKRVLKRTLAAVAQATVAGAADTIGQRFDAGPGSRSLTLAGRQVGGSYRVPETAATAAGPRAGVASDPRIAGGGAYDDVERGSAIRHTRSMATPCFGAARSPCRLRARMRARAARTGRSGAGATGAPSKAARAATAGTASNGPAGWVSMGG